MKANPKATGRIGYSLSVLVGVFFACASVWFCIQQFLFTIPLLLASSLLAFGAWRYQTLWLVVTPLVIALGSLYPWTGNLTFQERDALLSAILAGRMVREMSGDQLSLYTTRNNTLQQATGYAMAAAFVPLIFAAFRRDANHGVSANFQAFSTGMQLTAFFVSLIVVLERLVTVGVFNFKEELRATGPFVSMHIGGQHIDAFWGFALPSPLPWKVRFRTQPAGEELGLMHVMVCHKSLLQSYEYIQPDTRLLDSMWEAELKALPNDLISMDAPRWRSWCPTTLSLIAGGMKGAAVEVYDLNVCDAEGASVLRNSTFAEGSRGWFFTCDDHQIWRAKNCWLHLAVELGFTGVAAFAWLMMVVLFGLLKVSWVTRSWQAFSIGWSLIGFLSMGLFGSLLDTPWITMLLMLVLAMGHGMGIPKFLAASR